MSRETTNSKLTLDETIARATEKLRGARHTKDGRIHGSAVHGNEMSIRRRWFADSEPKGATWNDACEVSHRLMDEILSALGYDRYGRPK